MTARTARRARTVATEVVQPEPELPTVSTAELVAKFLGGENARSSDFSTIDNALYEGQTIIARRAPDGSVLLPTDSVKSVELNDQLMGQLFAKGTQFRRVAGFSNLTNAEARKAELKSGAYDDFKAIAKLFNFEYSDDDFAALDRAKAFSERTGAFFGAIQAAELEKVQAAERAAREERLKSAIENWDTDLASNPVNSSVHGAGGGQRLRLRPAGHSRVTRTNDRWGGRHTSTSRIATSRIETSVGHTVALTSAKRAFEFASKYWHGGKPIGAYVRMQGRGGHAVHVYPDRIQYGCQSVTRREAERFADVAGWDRAIPE
jgi:hypothetical protein